MTATAREMDAVATDAEKLDRWHRDELRRLGFRGYQERHLRALIDLGEVSLEEVREKVERRGWGHDQVMACYAA